jgi:hypothetical protein
MRETAQPEMVRLYERHRIIKKRAARKLRISKAEVVRRALEAFAF